MGKIFKKSQHIMNFHNTDSQDSFWKIHICKHCGKSYGTPALLKAHIDQFHNRENCPHCGKSVLNRFYLKKHLVFDHGIKDGALFCDVCPKKVFFIEGMYKKHMREKHDRPEWFKICELNQYKIECFFKWM